jgi:hypothetical protein
MLAEKVQNSQDTIHITEEGKEAEGPKSGCLNPTGGVEGVEKNAEGKGRWERQRGRGT